MSYASWADLVAIAHFTYAATIVLGLLAILIGHARGWKFIRNRWLRGVHLFMIAYVVGEAWLGVTCPLTLLEAEYRRKAGQPFDGDNIVVQAIHAMLFFDAPWWVFTVCYTTCGALVLATLIWIPPNWSGRRVTSNSE